MSDLAAPNTPLPPVPADENVPDNADAEAWRAKIFAYYKTNVPTKIKMVNSKMMEKWAGKYDVLYQNLIKKYGPLGHPLPVSTLAPGAGGKKSMGDFKDSFINLVAKAAPQLLPERNVDVVKSKAGVQVNGLETSTFTVCSRVRPILPHELEKEGGENFAVIVPGQR